MKAKLLCILLSLAMLASLTTVMAVSVSADSGTLQVCTDIVEVNGQGHESTSQLTADAWFDQTYGDTVVDEDGTVATFRVRGWVNPLDGSDMQQFGYSIDGDIVWDDSFMAENAGLRGYFAKAERFDVTVNLSYLPVGTYEFHLYAKTTSGVHEVEEESFIFEKKSTGEYGNVALGKDVYADQSMEASFFGAAMLVDGTVEDFVSNDSKLGWVCSVGDPMLQERDQEIGITIDLGGKYEIGRVNVLPMLFLTGSGFPSSFTILAGMSLGEMAPVATVENINETTEDATTNPTVLNFDPVVCQYVELRIDRASWLQEADGSYLSEIGEIEVIGREVPPTTYTVTFKDGDTVVAEVTYKEGAKSIKVPDVPAKEGFEGAWAEFTLNNEDIEVQAVYTEVAAPATEAETDAATEPATEAATTAETVEETAAATEAATEAAATEADTAAPAATEEATATAYAYEGCSSVVSVAAAVVLLCGAAVLKKRKD